MVQDDLLKNLLSKLVRVEDISYAPDEQVFANCSLIDVPGSWHQKTYLTAWNVICLGSVLV